MSDFIGNVKRLQLDVLMSHMEVERKGVAKESKQRLEQEYKKCVSELRDLLKGKQLRQGMKYAKNCLAHTENVELAGRAMKMFRDEMKRAKMDAKQEARLLEICCRICSSITQFI